MAVKLNEDKEVVKAIKDGLKAKGGYCPCRIEINDDNCPDTYIYNKICEFLNNNYDFIFKDQIPEDLYLIWCFND